jgi:multidrug efflux pump subunit AcrA (membrane-fusion protein)
VATVFGTDAVEVRLPLDDAELAWFDLPSRGTPSVAARVEADLGGAHQVWEGWLERLEGQVDPKSRMVHVVVRVDDPFAPGDRPPLFPGSFVDVTIAGRDLEDVMPIPRHALREGDTLWVVQDGHLSIRAVEVARRDRDHVMIKSGVDVGELVVTSSLDVATEGMIVRVGGDVSDG